MKAPMQLARDVSHTADEWTRPRYIHRPGTPSLTLRRVNTLYVLGYDVIV